MTAKQLTDCPTRPVWQTCAGPPAARKDPAHLARFISTAEVWRWSRRSRCSGRSGSKAREDETERGRRWASCHVSYRKTAWICSSEDVDLLLSVLRSSSHLGTEEAKLAYAWTMQLSVHWGQRSFGCGFLHMRESNSRHCMSWRCAEQPPQTTHIAIVLHKLEGYYP